MWTPLRETPRIDEPEVRARGEPPHYPPQKGRGFVIHLWATLLRRSPVRQGAWALGAWDRSAQNADQTLTAVSYTHPQSQTWPSRHTQWCLRTRSQALPWGLIHLSSRKSG